MLTTPFLGRQEGGQGPVDRGNTQRHEGTDSLAKLGDTREEYLVDRSLAGRADILLYVRPGGEVGAIL